MDKSKTVLLVDDEPQITKLLSFALCQYNVYCVFSVDDAIDFIENNTCHAVVCDLKMPDKNGIELLEFVKANFSHLPVILISAHILSVVEAEKVDKLAFTFLSKPFKTDELAKQLKNALNSMSAIGQ